LQGCPDQARRAAERSVAQAQALNHSLSLCYSLGSAACPIALLAGDLTAEGSLSELGAAFCGAIDALERAIRYVVENYATDIRSVSVGAVPMLRLLGIVAGGWQLLRSALISRRRLTEKKAGSVDAAFHEAKISTARFYADHVLSQSSGLAHSIVRGAAAALACDMLPVCTGSDTGGSLRIPASKWSFSLASASNWAVY